MASLDSRSSPNVRIVKRFCAINHNDKTKLDPCKLSIDLESTDKLQYKIHRFSSFSTNYVPENILVDCPSDQSSRWSAHNNNPPQYLTLKLRRPSIVKSVKFGKFEKSHVCNIKKFRIYGGLSEETMPLLLEAGLRNDHIPETFILRYKTEDGQTYLPILYLKIVPLLSWGPTFNYSIWYVELHGQDDPMYTNNSLREYNKLREVEVVRLCLKHFRQQGYDQAFAALQEQTQVRLEHPIVSELHKCLVIDGEFERAEQLMGDYIADGLMDTYLSRQSYKHTWNLQTVEGFRKPGNRGGHQLVMDSEKSLIYLYGGWDGYRDLSDLWVFQITNKSWTQLCKCSEDCNGPTPRSCHKMIYDPISRNIFMLGRYLDNSIRTTEYIKSDFYLYDTRADIWLQICDDTSQVGGPQLLYDHQMCIDAEKRMIYVFGGKILTPRSVSSSTTNEPEYSGLFSYHIATNTWTQIMVDCHHPTASLPNVWSVKSRITHCMVFHPKRRKLYIYGGQRAKLDIHEFISYDVDTQSVEILNKGDRHWQATASSGENGEGSNEPSPTYTLRATIDCERDEIYMFSSLCKSKDRRDIQHLEAANSFWVYSLNDFKWSRVYMCNYDGWENNNHYVKDKPLEPCPRYAHQFIYDEVDKLHYMFGGNPGKSEAPQSRLDDFWLLVLEKPKREEILNHCRYLIRKLHYKELIHSDLYTAMMYLRHHIAEVVDHNNKEQVKNFHKLACLLFQSNAENAQTVQTEQTKVDKEKSLGTTSRIELLNNETEETERNVSLQPSGDFYSADFCTSSATTPSPDISDSMSPLSSYNQPEKGSKRARHDIAYELKSQRAFLFNKLVELLPPNMVQPDRNLSDFVIM